MSSFTSDERGVIEPYTELPAMALAVVGFVVFIAIVAQAYATYEEKSYIAGHYQDAADLARKLADDGSLAGIRPDVIDSGKLEAVRDDPGDIIEKYGSYYNFMFKVESYSENRAYSIIIKSPELNETKKGVSASIPVTVRLNDVEEQPGILTVKIWSKK